MEPLQYRVGRESGNIYVFPYRSEWAPLFKKEGGSYEEVRDKERIVKGFTFKKDKVEEIKQLVKRINEGEIQPESKIKEILINGGDTGITLVKYGDHGSLVIYGVKWEDKGIQAKLKEQGGTFEKKLEKYRGFEAAWHIPKANNDKVRAIKAIVSEANNVKLGIKEKKKVVIYEPSSTSEPHSEPSSTSEPHSEPSSTSEPSYTSEPVSKNVKKGYQRVVYVVEKPYVNQQVVIEMQGKTINTRVARIVPGSSDVVDLIQLENEEVAAIIAGRWELLYFSDDHTLFFK